MSHNFSTDGDYILKMRFMSGRGQQFDNIDISVDGEHVATVKYGGGIDFQGTKSFPVEKRPANRRLFRYRR